MRITSEQISDDPSYFLMNVNIVQRKCQFVAVTESVYYDRSFLDERLLASISNSVQFDLGKFNQVWCQKSDRSLDSKFIFHIGHCGSTLISRALAATATVLPLREPLTMRFLAESLRQIALPTSFCSEVDWGRLKTGILECNARRFHPDQSPMIKLTSTCNNLIDPMLRESSERRGLMVYSSLEDYLAVMLADSAGDVRLADARMQAPAAISDWYHLGYSGQLRLCDLSHEQMLVIAWLMNIRQFESARKSWPDQTRFVNFDDFLVSPESQLESITRFFGFEDQLPAIFARYDEIAGRYSKRTDFKYQESTRREGMERTRQIKAGQIRSAMAWAERTIEDCDDLAVCRAYLRHSV